MLAHAMFPVASFHKCASALKIVVMRAGSLKAEFGFEVSIQVLIRVERWRISRKVKKALFPSRGPQSNAERYARGGSARCRK